MNMFGSGKGGGGQRFASGDRYCKIGAHFVTNLYIGWREPFASGNRYCKICAHFVTNLFAKMFVM